MQTDCHDHVREKYKKIFIKKTTGTLGIHPRVSGLECRVGPRDVERGAGLVSWAVCRVRELQRRDLTGLWRDVHLGLGLYTTKNNASGLKL